MCLAPHLAHWDAFENGGKVDTCTGWARIAAVYALDARGASPLQIDTNTPYGIRQRCGGVMGKRRRARQTCRWKQCTATVVEGYPLCRLHLLVPPPPRTAPWIRELAYNLGVGVASSVLFEVIRTLYGLSHATGVNQTVMQRLLEIASRFPLLEFVSNEDELKIDFDDGLAVIVYMSLNLEPSVITRATTAAFERILKRTTWS